MPLLLQEPVLPQGEGADGTIASPDSRMPVEQDQHAGVHFIKCCSGECNASVHWGANGSILPDAAPQVHNAAVHSTSLGWSNVHCVAINL